MYAFMHILMIREAFLTTFKIYSIHFHTMYFDHILLLVLNPSRFFLWPYLLTYISSFSQIKPKKIKQKQQQQK